MNNNDMSRDAERNEQQKNQQKKQGLVASEQKGRSSVIDEDQLRARIEQEVREEHAKKVQARKEKRSAQQREKAKKAKAKKPRAPEVNIDAARANYPPVIEVKDVWKKYHGPFGGDWVLKGVNFTIPRGVSVGLVGKNGAGKSTLLKLLGGMDAPDKGSIKENCRISWPIGLSGGFQGSMSARQNVKFVARIMGGEQNIDEIVERVQAFAEIGKAFDQPINTYSSGMRSRIAFGLSLAFEFDVYLSDEATAVGDVTFKAKARQAFHDRVGKASIIMVSHSVGMLQDLCQAGIWLHEGQAFWFDKLDDAVDAYYQSIGKK